MIVRPLNTVGFDELMECFLEAFQTYFVKMPTDYDYYKQRWKNAKVNYGLSYGMFDNEKLIGFIINAIDKRGVDYVAFNSGTGVIPGYRGKRIVKEIYDLAIPKLRRQGITKCALEVIVDNERAIKSYQSIGFKVCKTLKCFSGELQVQEEPFELKELNFKDIDWDLIPNQEFYSWDNERTCLNDDFYKYFQVYHQEKLDSFFVINPETGYIAQCEVFNAMSESWRRLFTAIASISKSVRINNVDTRLKEKLFALKSVGLKNTIDQYEMEYKI